MRGVLMGFEKKDLETTDKCPECGGETILNSIERLCKQCGLVITNNLVESAFIHNQSKVKNNLNKQYVSLGKRQDFIGGLGSFMDYEKSRYLKDRRGKLLSPNGQKLYRRLKKNYDQFSRIKDHETEYRIFNILEKITRYLNLNKNIQNTAAYYYKKILKNEEKILNNISLIAFCVFFAVRNEYHNAPITINEISIAFQNFGHRVNPRLILRDGVRYKHHLNNNSTPHKSEDYLIRFVDQVIKHKDLPERMQYKGITWSRDEYQSKITLKCRDIFKKLVSEQRGGRNPFILTGAVIYLADRLLSKEFHQKAVLTQQIISEATRIAEYSVRDHYVNLLKPLFFKN